MISNFKLAISAIVARGKRQDGATLVSDHVPVMLRREN